MAFEKNKKILVTVIVVMAVAVGTAAVTKGWVRFGTSHRDDDVFTQTDLANAIMDMDDIGTPTGDDPWQETEKLVTVYYGNGKLVTYQGKMTLTDGDEKLLEHKDFTYSIISDQFTYRLGQLECIGKKNFMLLIDHDMKTISKLPILASEKDGAHGMFDVNRFRQMMESTGAQAHVTQNENEKILTVTNISDPSMQGYQVFYDPTNFRIHKILIAMIRYQSLDEAGVNETATASDQAFPGNEENAYLYHVQISYDKMELSAMNVKDFKPEDRFVRAAGNKWETTAAFKNYQLADSE